MTKLVLHFRGKCLDSYRFDEEEVTIGRDEECSIKIDSLAVSPVHASIRLNGKEAEIIALNDDAPVLINGKKIEQHPLTDGDHIGIGKHVLSYILDEVISKPDMDPEFVKSPTTPVPPKEIDASLTSPCANIQILSGKNIGRVISLKQAMTRLGKPGSSTAIISRRKGGYFLSSLENGLSIKVNQVPIDDKIIKLSNSDKIELDQSAMRFFF